MIVVIDYGVGNVKSVTNAVRHIGCDVRVSCERDDIEKADGIILPGVGACGYAMKVLGPLAEVIRDVARGGKPLLGICLGFQLLFDQSHEHGVHECLGLIRGKVIRIPGGVDANGAKLTIPHMGWNLVKLPAGMGLFAGLGPEQYFPFANSYYADITDDEATVAYTNYGIDIAASVQKGNIFGCQFHPEKSAAAGLDILRNFERICEGAST
ncbi:MAG: imidazole glycerol phosphate synthase subunit HisH [Planctomycetota bacterium]|jgi:glutamine amidotransferase